MTINPAGERHVYRQLADILRDQIMRGQLRGQFPSEARLQSDYRVSRGTARHAAQVLRDEGLIRKTVGRGYFVVPRAERPG